MSLNATLGYTATRNDVALYSVIVAFVSIHAFLMLLSPLLPFIDLPNHLAEATIFKYYDNTGNNFSSFYYPTPWYFPNSFHTVFCSLFGSVEIGNKIFHILYLILLQISLFLVIKRFNGNQWYGLLGLVLTYNYNVTFGFVGFAISIPTILILFYCILLDLDHDKPKWKVCIAILLVLLYSMHAQNALFGALLYGAITLAHYRRNLLKAVINGALVSLPLIAVMIFWWVNKDVSKSESTLAYLLRYYSGEYWTTFLNRFGLVAFDNYSLFEGTPGLIVASLFSLLFIVPLIVFKTWKRSIVSLLKRAEYPLIFFLVSAACFFILPDKLPGQAPLYERFCTIVLLSFIIVASIWLKEQYAAWIKIVAVTALCVYTILWSEYIITFNNANRDFNPALFSGTDHQGRLAGIIVDNKYRGRMTYIHFQNYFIVWRNGIATSKIIDYRFGVIRRQASLNTLPFYNEYVSLDELQRYGYDDMEYLLIKNDHTEFIQNYYKHFNEIKRAGTWTLYQNTKTRREQVKSSAFNHVRPKKDLVMHDFYEN